VSLSAHDRHALDLIGESLAGSDPHLAAMMSAFSRLAEGEEMPGRERIQGDGGRHEATRRQRWRRPGMRVALAWLFISLLFVAVVAVSLTLGHTRGGGSCTSWQIPACGNHATTHHQQGPTLPGLNG
jgi:hypothetical protein